MAQKKRRPKAPKTAAKAARSSDDRRERFVQEYLVDLNATQAAIRAGYSPRSARQQGQALLSNPAIRAAIDSGVARRSQDTGVEAALVLRELAHVAFADPAQVFDFSAGPLRLKPAREIPEQARRAIASIKIRKQKGKAEQVEVRFWSKPEALRDLGRHLKLFTDQVRIDNLDELIERELARVAGGSETKTAGAAPSDRDASGG